jgi:hypothetical protein
VQESGDLTVTWWRKMGGEKTEAHVSDVWFEGGWLVYRDRQDSRTHIAIPADVIDKAEFRRGAPERALVA